MKNDYAKINALIRIKMESLFLKGRDIERFIKETKLDWLNIKIKILVQIPGTYTDIVKIRGWRVQQSNIIKNYYQFLDPDGFRRAQTYDPNSIVKALDSYEATIKISEL